MGDRRFPVHPSDATPECDSVPWDFLAPHEKRALKNHDQTLARLAERGGLSFCEMIAVVEDRSWSPIRDSSAKRQIEELLANWEASRG